MGAADLFSERAFTPRSSTPKPIASFSTQPSRTLCDEESSISLPDAICCVLATFLPSRLPGATFNKLEIKKQRRLGNRWQILEKAPSSVTNEFANVVTLYMVQERMAFVSCTGANLNLRLIQQGNRLLPFLHRLCPLIGNLK